MNGTGPDMNGNRQHSKNRHSEELARAKKPKDSRVLFVYGDRICTRREMRSRLYRRYNGKDYAPWKDPSVGFSKNMCFGERLGAKYNSWNDANEYYTVRKNAEFIRQEKNGRALKDEGNAYEVRHGRPEGGVITVVLTVKNFFADFADILHEEFIEFLDSHLSESERERLNRLNVKRLAILHNRIREKAYLFRLTAILLAVAALFMFSIYKIVFVIDDVNVSGANVYTEAEIVESTNFDEGDNLYSFDAGLTEKSVMFGCPYVGEVTVERGIPRTVSLDVTEERGAYYADVWGDITVLSDGLRVLGTIDGLDAKEEAEELGLIRIVLPELRKSVAGKPVEFKEQTNERRVREVLDKVKKSALYNKGLITSVSIIDGNTVVLIVGGNCRMSFDSSDDFEYKLSYAYSTYTSDSFDRLTPSEIDMKPDNPVVESNPMFSFE